MITVGQPPDEFIGGHGLPLCPRRAQGKVIGKTIVPEEDLELAASRRPVEGLCVAAGQPAGAAGENHPEAHRLGDAGHVVSVDEFRVPEGPRHLAEERPDLAPVKGDLPPELLLGKERGQGVVPGPAQKLHAARVGKPPKALQERLPPIFQLFKKHARDGAGNPEAATVAPDEPEQGRVDRQVALHRPALEDPAALLLVEIILRMPDVEEAVLLQPKRQVGMETQNNRGHRIVYPVYSV